MINNTYTSEWSLREEILRVTQRWPEIIAFCLLGSLVGLVISFCLPSPIRATRELYVGLNVFEGSKDRNSVEHAGLSFYNPDDYKNWQMANLNSMIFMDKIIDQTLENLRRLDPHWYNLDRNDLANMFSAYWRNAGKWRLVAEDSDSRYARQAVLAWEEVLVNQVHNAVSESQNVMILNSHLQSLSLVHSQLISKTIELSQIRELLRAWRKTASQKDTKLPVDESDRNIVRHLVDQANLGISQEWLMDSFPRSGAPINEYITWIDSITPVLDQQLLIDQNQAASLEEERNEIRVRYAYSASNSLGLSGDLLVEKLSGNKTNYAYVRPIGLLILIGGLLGIITWIIYWLIKFSLLER